MDGPRRVAEQDQSSIWVHLFRVSVIDVSTLTPRQVLAESEGQNRLTGTDLQALNATEAA